MTHQLVGRFARKVVGALEKDMSSYAPPSHGSLDGSHKAYMVRAMASACLMTSFTASACRSGG